MRAGPFYPDHGLERIVAYHERQDARFAEAAAEVSERTGKPILTATELAVTDPANAGPAAVRASGRLCYASANRAVTALDHLWRRARFLEQRRRARLHAVSARPATVSWRAKPLTAVPAHRPAVPGRCGPHHGRDRRRAPKLRGPCDELRCRWCCSWWRWSSAAWRGRRAPARRRPAARPSPRSATPLLSARRVPEWLAAPGWPTPDSVGRSTR